MTHGYFGIDLEKVWETVNTEIPFLIEDFETILKDIDGQ